MTKLNNSKCDKTQIVTKLKNTNYEKNSITQIVTKLKLWQNSKNLFVIKLFTNCDKTWIYEKKTNLKRSFEWRINKFMCAFKGTTFNLKNVLWPKKKLNNIFFIFWLNYINIKQNTISKISLSLFLCIVLLYPDKSLREKQTLSETSAKHVWKEKRSNRFYFKEEK